MKKAIFITVRTSSTRLPKKCLLDLHGARAIEFLIRRLKRSACADGIVLCTTTNAQDDILCEIAQKEGIAFFRGSEKDKLERWKGVADQNGVDFFVTADGDDLFCDTELIDLAFRQEERTRADFIEGIGVPCGAFTYGIRVDALRKVCAIKDTDDTEMMWVYFKDTGLFKVEELQDVPAMLRQPEIRMTLDYQDDWEFFQAVDSALKDKGAYNLRDILVFLNAHPEVVKINQHRQQQFLDNQRSKTKLVIKTK